VSGFGLSDTVIKNIKETLLNIYLDFLENGKKVKIEAKLMTSN
jgi:hypothetical protein